jgi:hypothetical protein
MQKCPPSSQNAGIFLFSRMTNETTALPISAPAPAHERTWLRLVAWLLGLPTALVLLFVGGIVAINLHDVRLKPDVAAVLREPGYIVPDAQNAFFVLRGMEASEHLDALAAGRDFVQADEARFRIDPARYPLGTTTARFASVTRSSWNSARCMDAVTSCIQADLDGRTLIEAKLAQNAVLLQRWEQMQSMSGFEEHIIPDATAVRPRYDMLADAAEMSAVQASLDIEDGDFERGVARLETDNRYLRFLLRNTVSMQSRMAVIGMVRTQTRVVSELIEAYPVLMTMYDDRLTALVRPLSESEQRFGTIVVNEARMDQRVLHWNVDASNGWQTYLQKLLFHPNATLNQLVNLRLTRVAAVDVPIAQLDDALAQLRQSEEQLTSRMQFPSPRYAYNPLGKTLAMAAYAPPDQLFSFIRRSADLDGYLRLVSLQIELRRKRIPYPNIGTVVSAAPLPFRSPYDGSTFTWNAEKKRLQFIGRESTNRYGQSEHARDHAIESSGNRHSLDSNLYFVQLM